MAIEMTDEEYAAYEKRQKKYQESEEGQRELAHAKEVYARDAAIQKEYDDSKKEEESKSEMHEVAATAKEEHENLKEKKYPKTASGFQMDAEDVRREEERSAYAKHRIAETEQRVRDRKKKRDEEEVERREKWQEEHQHVPHDNDKPDDYTAFRVYVEDKPKSDYHEEIKKVAPGVRVLTVTSNDANDQSPDFRNKVWTLDENVASKKDAEEIKKIKSFSDFAASGYGAAHMGEFASDTTEQNPHRTMEAAQTAKKQLVKNVQEEQYKSDIVRSEEARQMHTPVKNKSMVETIEKAVEFGKKPITHGNTSNYATSAIPIMNATDILTPEEKREKAKEQYKQNVRTEVKRRANISPSAAAGAIPFSPQGDPLFSGGSDEEAKKLYAATKQAERTEAAREAYKKQLYGGKSPQPVGQTKPLGNGDPFQRMNEDTISGARMEENEWMKHSNQSAKAKVSEMKADYSAGKSSGGAMGVLRDIITHPHDTAQEIGYAATKKAEKFEMQRKQETRSAAAKQLEPEYQRNDQKLREGKISREMHELRQKQLDEKFESKSTPIEQKVGGVAAREAASIFGMFNEAITSPATKEKLAHEEKKRLHFENKQREKQGLPPITPKASAFEGNTVSAAFARGLSNTMDQVKESQKAPVVSRVLKHGAMVAPSRKEFGGKGTRKSSPTKGTVVTKGGKPAPRVNFAAGGFGSPIAFNNSSFALFGRGQPAPAPAPAPAPKTKHHKKR
jgi:hypothetical protein